MNGLLQRVIEPRLLRLYKWNFSIQWSILEERLHSSQVFLQGCNLHFSSSHNNFSPFPKKVEDDSRIKPPDIFGSGHIHFLVLFPHLKEILNWGFGIPQALSWTVRAPWGSGFASWRKLCVLDPFSCGFWIRDGALPTPEAAVSGPFSVLSEALPNLCLKGLRDGNFQKNPVPPHLPLPNGAREAPNQDEGQAGEG